MRRPQLVNQCFSICSPVCVDKVQNKTRAVGSRLGSLASVLGAEMLVAACCLSSLRKLELLLHCVDTLAWLQGGRLHLTRYQAGACWGPGTIKSAPGGLSRGSITSTALPALVDGCACGSSLSHSCRSGGIGERNSFPVQAPSLTSDV